MKERGIDTTNFLKHNDIDKAMLSRDNPKPSR
jgi:hypothetical protein